MLMPFSWKLKTPPIHSASRYICPLEEFIKMNFNGASKGNPGEVGFGGIFRNHHG